MLHAQCSISVRSRRLDRPVQRRRRTLRPVKPWPGRAGRSTMRPEAMTVPAGSPGDPAPLDLAQVEVPPPIDLASVEVPRAEAQHAAPPPPTEAQHAPPPPPARRGIFG